MKINVKAGFVGGLSGVLCVAWSAAEAAVPTGQSPLFADAMLERALVEFIGAGAAFGALGLVLKLALEHIREHGRTIRQPTLAAAATGATVVELPGADATASEFDDVRRRDFAPVVSLTEAQVERRRDARAREQRRATRSRA